MSGSFIFIKPIIIAVYAIIAKNTLTQSAPIVNAQLNRYKVGTYSITIKAIGINITYPIFLTLDKNNFTSKDIDNAIDGNTVK